MHRKSQFSLVGPGEVEEGVRVTVTLKAVTARLALSDSLSQESSL